MTEPTVIGIDVGTGAVKAILMDLDGGVLSTFARAYPTARPRTGEVEQNPLDWIEGVLRGHNESAYEKGKRLDFAVFSLLRPEWQARRKEAQS